MEDQSIYNGTNVNTDNTILSGQTSTADQQYVNECIKEVCLNGDSLSKYQRMIEKKFDASFYQKCENFVEEVRRSVERRKFTNTSVTNLKYLANEIDVPVDTIDSVLSHFSKQFAEEERKEAEEQKRMHEEQRKKEEAERIRQRQLAEQAEIERRKARSAQNRKEAGKAFLNLLLGVLKLLFLLLRLFIGVPLCVFFGIIWIIVALARPENKYKVEKALKNIVGFIVNKRETKN